jgi:hypothetical protein
VLLPLIAREGVPLTADQIRGRCTDPWAAPLVDDWLREAFERGLVHVRRISDLPAEWKLTKKGEHAAKS